MKHRIKWMDDWWLANKNDIQKSSVRIIKFVKTLPETTDWKWDASEEEDGSVMCAMVENTLYISSENGQCVYANPQSEYAFSNFNNLETIENPELFNTSQIVFARSMFNDVGRNAHILNLDLHSFDMSSVRTTNMMFSRAGQKADIVRLNVSGWNLAMASDFSYMFSQVAESSIDVEINLNGWKSPVAKTMYNMFAFVAKNADKFPIKGLENLDTKNVETMNSMFYMAAVSCKDFNLDLNNWNIDKVESFVHMFAFCAYAAKKFYLNLTKWNPISQSDTTNMFEVTGRFAKNWTIRFAGTSLPAIEENVKPY